MAPSTNMQDTILDAVASSIVIKSDPEIIAIANVSDDIINKLDDIDFKVKPCVVDRSLVWSGANAFFIVESIWDRIQAKQGISMTFAKEYGSLWAKLRKTYSQLCVKKIVPEAIIPSQAHPLDSGFDISIVRIVNPNFGPGVILYGTGLIIRPPDGYYIDMVARSSLCKMGWMVANCVGIIDAQYRGELCVPLAKINDKALPLELPARIGQIIVRALNLCDLVEVDEIESTQRGAGGFGSSGK